MQHLTEEQIVLHHYHDGDGAAEAEKHLAVCAECRAQTETLERVLALVDTMPVPERGERYSEQVWNRLRWKLGSERRRVRHWQMGFAAAAMLAIAFISGILWHQRTSVPATSTTQTVQIVQPVKTPIEQPKPNQILLVVVSDHLNQSERMLTELANADSKHSFDMTEESKRAEDLVASNRIYRLTAQQRGETRIASLLSDLEPVLLELAHAGRSLTPAEVGALQRRIDDKGLLFKVRVVSAQTKGTDSL